MAGPPCLTRGFAPLPTFCSLVSGTSDPQEEGQSPWMPAPSTPRDGSGLSHLQVVRALQGIHVFCRGRSLCSQRLGRGGGGGSQHVRPLGPGLSPGRTDSAAHSFEALSFARHDHTMGKFVRTQVGAVPCCQRTADRTSRCYERPSTAPPCALDPI